MQAMDGTGVSGRQPTGILESNDLKIGQGFLCDAHCARPLIRPAAVESEVRPQRCSKKADAAQHHLIAVQQFDIMRSGGPLQAMQFGFQFMSVKFVIASDIDDRRVSEVRAGPWHSIDANVDISGKNDDVGVNRRGRPRRELEMQVRKNADFHAGLQYLGSKAEAMDHMAAFHSHRLDNVRGNIRNAVVDGEFNHALQR